ncbi:MAG: hypothetical protein RL235_989 [Chlamydiota bacterium]
MSTAEVSRGNVDRGASFTSSYLYTPTVQQAVQKRVKRAHLTLKDDAWMLFATGASGLEMTRQILPITEKIKSKPLRLGRVAKGVSYGTGAIGLILGASEISGGLRERKEAAKIGDMEGVIRGEVRTFAGGMVTGATLAFIAEEACLLAARSKTVNLAAHLGGLSCGAAGVASVVAMAVSVRSVYACKQFRSKLNVSNLTANPETDAKLYLKALHKLKNALTVTDEEKANIKAIAKDNAPMAEMELLQVKIVRFRRRASLKAIEMVVDRSPAIMQKLADPALRAQGLVEAEQLFKDLRWENTKKMSVHIVAFFAAAVSLIGVILLSIGSFGLVPLFLSLASTAVYLIISLTIYTQKKFSNRQLTLPDNVSVAATCNKIN